MCLGIQPSADPLSHASVTSYYKSLGSYSQASHQQVKELPQIPIQRILLFPVWILVAGCLGNVIRGRQSLKPIERELPSALDTDFLAKLKGIEPWVHVAQLNKAPPDTWSHAGSGDL